jgi:hypothetical protein
MKWITKLKSNYSRSILIPIVNGRENSFNRYPVDDYRGLKEGTEQVKFECFTDKRKDQRCANGNKSPMCCCLDCYTYAGHFHEKDLIFAKDIPKYEALFEPKVGFWRKNKGCALPRALRSHTCLTYYCLGGGCGHLMRAVNKQLEAYAKRITLDLQKMNIHQFNKRAWKDIRG